MRPILKIKEIPMLYFLTGIYFVAVVGPFFGRLNRAIFRCFLLLPIALLHFLWSLLVDLDSVADSFFRFLVVYIVSILLSIAMHHFDRSRKTN